MISLANSPVVISNKPVRRRCKTQGGSAMLEGALVMLPLMAICFALLDFPLAIFIQNTLRNAAREGVRFAVTQQTGAGGQDATIKTTVENNSMGFLNNADLTASPARATITITYYDPTQVGMPAVSGANSNSQGNICVITATVTRGWMVPLWRDAGLFTFSASSSDVMEAPPAGVLPSR